MKELHEVSNAINILDPSNNTDKAICKKGAYDFTGGQTDKELADKCGVSGNNTTHANSTGEGLSLLFRAGATSGGTDGGNYHKNQTEQMGPITSGVISKDVTALNREQKGVVSSAFAKAQEGAEIVEARVLTVSIMDGGGTISRKPIVT